MLVLSIKAGANRYAIDVARVIELVPRVELRTIPHAPPFLAGLLGYRGHIMPVIDLGLLLDATPCRPCLGTRIILVNDAPADHNQGRNAAEGAFHGHDGHRGHLREDGTSLLGLIAEEASELAIVQPEQIMPAPVELPQAPFLGQILQTPDGILQLIMVERIREIALGSSILDQGMARIADPLRAETGPVPPENSSTLVENPGSGL